MGESEEKIEKMLLEAIQNEQIVPIFKLSSIDKTPLFITNRLSDYFFAVARVVNFRANCPDVSYKRSGKVFHNGPTK